MNIDDITIAGPSPVNEVPVGFKPAKTAPGRPAAYGAPAGNGLFVTICPDTRIMTVRISVPRYLQNIPVNFPLIPLRRVEDLKLESLASTVGSMFGIRLSVMGGVASRRFPFREWGVIRVSYAMDLKVRDPISCVEGAMGLRRRNVGVRHVFGGEKFSTILWGSRALQVKLYAKQEEIESHVSVDEIRSSQLAHRARQARGVLRFEVSLKQVSAIRRLFPKGMPGHLPMLHLMCDPRMARWVVRREARRLRLDEASSLCDVESPSVHARRVVDVLKDAQAQMAAGEFELGRLKSMTEERLRSLALVHFLGAGLRGTELQETLGLSRPAVAELLQQLRALGLPPDSTPRTTLGDVTTEINDALVRAGVYPPVSFDDLNGVWAVRTPWAEDEDDVPEDDGNDEDDVSEDDGNDEDDAAVPDGVPIEASSAGFADSDDDLRAFVDNLF